VGFLSTVPGVLKIAEILIGFVAFILTICADRRSASTGWTEHVCFETMVVVSALLIGYVIFPHLTLNDERTREGLIVVELLFYGINAFFFFISVWLMVHLAASWTADGRGAAIMDAVLCVSLVVLYSCEAYIKYKVWKGEDILNQSKKANPTIPARAETYSPSVPSPPIHQQQTTLSERDDQVTV